MMGFDFEQEVLLHGEPEPEIFEIPEHEGLLSSSEISDYTQPIIRRITERESERLTKEIRKTPENISIRQHYINNTDAANQMRGGYTLQELNAYFQKKYENGGHVLVQLRDMTNSPAPTEITAYDCAVMNAIFTLRKNHYDCVTVQTIARVMCGNLYAHVNKSRLQKIQDSINKLSIIWAVIESDEDLDLASHRSPLFVGKMSQVRLDNRQFVTAYFIKNSNSLDDYAEEIQHVIIIPQELMETPKGTIASDDYLILKRYLIQRIQIMRNPHNKVKGQTISMSWYDKNDKMYKGLLPSLGYREDVYSSWRVKKQRLNVMIRKILTELSQKEYISGYRIKTRKKGKYETICGYIIRL